MAMLLRYWLLSLAVAGLAHCEEDFGFEPPAGQLADEPPSPPAPQPLTPVRRLWGVPDATAYVGRLFHMRVPADAFSGEHKHYEARGPGKTPLPAWLLFDRASGLFEGVPTPRDAGETYVTVRAVGADAHDAAKDVFAIEVATGTATQPALSDAATTHKVRCSPDEDPTFVQIVLDVSYDQLKPKHRVTIINTLASFLALHPSAFWLSGQRWSSLQGIQTSVSGRGDSRRRLSKEATVVRWQAGCDGHLQKPHTSLVAQLGQQAKDGTIAELLGRPVDGWHVVTPVARERRDTGSGVSDEDDEYIDEGLDEEGVTESVPESRIVPSMVSPVFPSATAVPSPASSAHPHRHRHGEEVSATYRLPTSPLLYATIVSTPVLVPVRPTRLLSSEVHIEPSRAYNELAPLSTPVFVSGPDREVTDPDPTTTTEGAVEETDSSSTTEWASSPSSSEEPSTWPQTTQKTSSTVDQGEEIITDTKNIRPSVDHRLPKIAITAGKAHRYVIPDNTFSDLEDGNTRSLRLIFKTSENRSVSRSSWVQFKPETQEVYALPLEEHVSRWTYYVEAMDREGATVSEKLELQIQHHKGRRTVNIEFSLHLRLAQMLDFQSAVDWQLHILDSLARLYGDPDTSQITVLNVTTAPSVVFSWTNDSLSRSHCPRGDLATLRERLVDQAGAARPALRQALGPSLVVSRVTVRGAGPCEGLDTFAPPVPRQPDRRYPPVLRNQVDHVNATVGALLVYGVPEDTFYDPEDGGTRHLRLTLLTMDRAPVSLAHWLQFDAKNQEFFGVPAPSDVGRQEYQLVAEDVDGGAAYDGLVVVVHAAPLRQHTAEFHLRLGTPYATFAAAAVKRRFVERLAALFGDRDPGAILLARVTAGSTEVAWHNRTLPTDRCADTEIERLRRLMIGPDEGPAERVAQVLGPEFPVLSATLAPAGLCLGQLTAGHVPPGPAPPADAPPATASLEYLVTFVVPGVVIAAMLLLAGVVACVLYRRRRAGKMAVEDERQAFRSKGIPVIFQDELEERADPENKSPVIMKEEKPPLPPPEYRRDDSPPPSRPLLLEDAAPYQPPPPFAADGARQARPKPTPTYRKPPPYVPP